MPGKKEDTLEQLLSHCRSMRSFSLINSLLEIIAVFNREIPDLLQTTIVYNL